MKITVNTGTETKLIDTNKVKAKKTKKNNDLQYLMNVSISTGNEDAEINSIKDQIKDKSEKYEKSVSLEELTSNEEEKPAETPIIKSSKFIEDKPKTDKLSDAEYYENKYAGYSDIKNNKILNEY